MGRERERVRKERMIAVGIKGKEKRNQKVLHYNYIIM